MYIENLEIILWNGKSDQAGRDDMHLNFFDQKNVVGQNGAVATIFETFFCVETQTLARSSLLKFNCFRGSRCRC